jgi:iron transport multicopper oxidase
MGQENKDTPASGRDPLSTLDDVVAHFKISRAGKLTLRNYFQPHDYLALNAAGKDLGSSGATLLDPEVFSGRSVDRLVVTAGKNGKVYVLDADDLGGFKNGVNGTDQVVQIIEARNGVFGGIGSYPREGGYI